MIVLYGGYNSREATVSEKEERQRRRVSQFKGTQSQTGHRFAANVFGCLSCRISPDRLHDVSAFQSITQEGGEIRLRN